VTLFTGVKARQAESPRSGGLFAAAAQIVGKEKAPAVALTDSV